jgi:hypothetical protein
MNNLIMCDFAGFLLKKDPGCLILDAGCWIPDTGYRIPDTGFLIPDKSSLTIKQSDNAAIKQLNNLAI